VDKAKAAAVAFAVGDDLARVHPSKGAKGIVQGLVVNGRVKVANEDVAHARTALGRVVLAPIDAHGPLMEGLEVELVQGRRRCTHQHCA
jgi:hypothetical protein